MDYIMKKIHCHQTWRDIFALVALTQHDGEFDAIWSCSISIHPWASAWMASLQMFLFARPCPPEGRWSFDACQETSPIAS
jgi:hypothetical protein